MQAIYIEVTGDDYEANRKLRDKLIAIVATNVDVGLYIYGPDDEQQRRYLARPNYSRASYLAETR